MQWRGRLGVLVATLLWAAACTNTSSGPGGAGAGGTAVPSGESGGAGATGKGGRSGTGGTRGLGGAGAGGTMSPATGGAGAGTDGTATSASGGTTSGGATTASTGGLATGGVVSSGGRSGGLGGASGAADASTTDGGAGRDAGPDSGDAATGTCDPSQREANRAVVAKALDELFVRKDPTAIDRYWADPYYQHNPIAQSGVATFRSLMSSLVTSSSFTYTPLLALADCELGLAYGRYSQTGVIFDMFRVQNGKLVEHWDSDTNQASETTNLGARDASASSEQSRDLFTSFAADVLVGGNLASAERYLGADYVEHHGQRATGPSALTAYLTSEKITYTKLHHVIADGNFVFALSEGKRGTAGYGFYDLFRVQAGKIVEHWDAKRSVPSSTASGLPIF